MCVCVCVCAPLLVPAAAAADDDEAAAAPPKKMGKKWKAVQCGTLCIGSGTCSETGAIYLLGSEARASKDAASSY